MSAVEALFHTTHVITPRKPASTRSTHNAGAQRSVEQQPSSSLPLHIYRSPPPWSLVISICPPSLRLPLSGLPTLFFETRTHSLNGQDLDPPAKPALPLPGHTQPLRGTGTIRYGQCEYLGPCEVMWADVHPRTSESRMWAQSFVIAR